MGEEVYESICQRKGSDMRYYFTIKLLESKQKELQLDYEGIVERSKGWKRNKENDAALSIIQDMMKDYQDAVEALKIMQKGGDDSDNIDSELFLQRV